MENYNSENNDIFDMENDLSMYKEPWQCTTWRTTHKSPKKDEDGNPVTEDPSDLSTLTVIRYSTYINKFAVGVKDFSFDELIQATKQGHSLKRIGTTPQGTRFLVIDIDNDGGVSSYPRETEAQSIFGAYGAKKPLFLSPCTLGVQKFLRNNSLAFLTISNYGLARL